MLTKKHLALIRAALKFWDEEMSPHGSESYGAYFEEDALGYLPTQEETAWLREQLMCCELRYAVCNDTLDKLIENSLFGSSEEASRDKAQVATFVIFSNSYD